MPYRWLDQQVCTFDVVRDTVNCHPVILTYIPLSSGVLQTVHLQETMAAIHFLAYLGHVSEFQLEQVHQVAHGESFPNHHLNSLSKKIKMKQKVQTSILIKKH